MDELNRVLETNIITPKLIIDEETLFNPDYIINYIDEDNNHYLVGNLVSVIIPKSEWKTFLNEIYSIYYKGSILGDKVEIREKLNPIDFTATMLYQMAYKHHANDFADISKKFLDVRNLKSKMNWGMIKNKMI
jgi:hypothetical protein